MDLRYLTELVDHGLHRSDWRAPEAALNLHGHFIADVRAAKLHFIHEETP